MTFCRSIPVFLLGVLLVSPAFAQFKSVKISNDLIIQTKGGEDSQRVFRLQVEALQDQNLKFLEESYTIPYGNTHNVRFAFDGPELSEVYREEVVDAIQSAIEAGNLPNHPVMRLAYINERDPDMLDTIDLSFSSPSEMIVEDLLMIPDHKKLFWSKSGTATFLLKGKLKKAFENHIRKRSKEDPTLFISPFQALKEDPFFARYRRVSNLGKGTEEGSFGQVYSVEDVKTLKEAILNLIRSPEFLSKVRKNFRKD